MVYNIIQYPSGGHKRQSVQIISFLPNDRERVPSFTLVHRKKVGGGIFLLTPNNVNIQGSISDEKDGKDIHDNDDINIEW